MGSSILCNQICACFFFFEESFISCLRDPTEYRPISLLSIVSKILERIVHSILGSIWLSMLLFSDKQWGFQKGKSTTSLLLHTTHDWFTLLDQQLEIMCVLFY